MGNGDFKKMPELFDYNQPAIESYKTPSYSNGDKALIAMFEALNAMDWNQTRQIARQPNKYVESSVSQGGLSGMLGKKPSQGKVNALMGAEALAVPALMHNVDDPYKKLLLGLFILAKMSAVKSNQSIGLDVVRW